MNIRKLKKVQSKKLIGRILLRDLLNSIHYSFAVIPISDVYVGSVVINGEPQLWSFRKKDMVVTEVWPMKPSRENINPQVLPFVGGFLSARILNGEYPHPPRFEGPDINIEETYPNVKGD